MFVRIVSDLFHQFFFSHFKLMCERNFNTQCHLLANIRVEFNIWLSQCARNLYGRIQ